MNPDKDEGEDTDPHGTASSNDGKRTQRQRNAPLLGNHHNNLFPSNNCNRENSPQQPASPRDFRQRPPRHLHHWGNVNPRPAKPPPPQQWQFFTRYRPFGESVRPYQLPPPPHFPQQFQFGTFPGRNSPRFRHRRENMAARGANDNTVNNNNFMHPNGNNMHNNHPDIPWDANVVRPKTGPFLNGKKKSNKYKHHSHDSSKSSRNRKGSRRLNETSQIDSHVNEIRGNENSLCGASGSLKENLFLTKDNDGIKISKSCDESWLDKTASEASFASAPNESDAQVAVEGAVGGLPPSNPNSIVADEGNVSPVSIDKDLIDEGAIFDLDNIFQNHEISQKGNSQFTNGGLDSVDDLDFVFDGENKGCDDTQLPSAESGQFFHSREGGRAGIGPAKLWSKCEKDVHHTHQRGVNTCDDSRSCIYVCDAENNGNSNNNSNINDIGEHDLVFSDGGEDTGDFIDTDLPSHAKHILSSSDEMDNQSSSKESDDEDDEVRASEGRQHFATKKREKSHSDFNSNDLSTLESHLLNSLSHLSMKTIPSNERGAHASGVSSLHNGETRKYCDLNDSNLSPSVGDSDASRNSKLTNECSCGSHVHSERTSSLSTVEYDFVQSGTTHTTVCGASAHNVSSPAPGNLLRFPVHPANSSALGSSLSHFNHSRSVNSRMCSSHQRQYVVASSEHAGSSASGGGVGPCIPPLESLNQHCSLDSNASGTSVNAVGCNTGGCCSRNPGVGNSVGSACHHQHNSYGHAAIGLAGNGIAQQLASNGMAQQLPSGVCLQDVSVAGEMSDQKATVSASAAERELDENSELLMMMMNMESSSSSGSSVAGGLEDPLGNVDNGDHVDMVLLPMEEEIEPVLYGGGVIGGDTDFDVEDDDDDYTMMSNALAARGFQSPCYTMAGVNSVYHHHPMAGPPRSFEETHGPHIRDPISIGNRLPSKEFYELIKTVSSTDSCMRFFDKDGHDVQRSVQKTSNDDTSCPTKGGGKQSKRSRSDTPKVDRVMIWNEYEAYVVQYKQIAVSACGQTAILNVLKALKFQCEKSVVCKVIKTNLRKEDKDIPEYLFSRTCAGTTAVELMSGVEKLTGGVIGGRFFHFWPPRKVKLLQWLAYWMKRGAIPMATLNLQQGPHSVWEVPDSWHHQMVYGVSHQGLYLTNPLEIVSERSAVKQLHSDSVLLVRRQDIVSRFRESTDLGQLLDHPDPRWMSMNVLGQVVNILRECNMPSVPGYRLQVTSHVKIPASYQAGITLFMRKDQPAWNALLTASELPLE